MRKLLVTLINLIVLNIFAQGYKHYTNEQGLAGNRVYKIIQDYDDFIWIATDNGISKFDGSTFKNFTIANGLPSNDIWELVLTKDNKLWFITRSNKLGYIKNDSVYAFKARNGEFFYPTVFCTDSKTLYFKSYNSNYGLVNHKWQKFSKSFLLINNGLMLNHPDYQFFYHSSKNKYTISDSLMRRKFEIELSYKDLYNKGQINDSLIVFTSQNSIHFINLNQAKQYTITNPDIFKENIYTRVIATEHSVQISTENYWAKLNDDYSLTDIKLFPKELKLTTVFKDRQGNYWGTTYINGFYFFPKNALWQQSYLTNEPVQFIKLFDDNLFAAVLDKGIYKYNPITKKFDIFFNNSDYYYDIFYKDNDNYAIMANKKTFIKIHGEIYNFGRLGKAIIPLENNLFAFRERKRISILNENNFTEEKSYRIEGVNDFILYNDHLICGNPVGLFQIENDSIKPIRFNATQSPIPILSLNKAGNHLIIGTDGLGAYIWDGEQKMNFLKETKGLIINDIFAKNDSIWLATQQGVFQYYFDHNKGLHFSRIMDKTDGAISNYVNNIVVYNHQIFTSNFSGIASIVLNLQQQQNFQKIYFKSILYNGKPIHNNEQIKYATNNNLSFNFGLIDYTGQENCRYYYQLLPIQEKWLEIDSKNINLSNLNINDYTINIKAINIQGKELIKSFHFTMTPLWWQTIWMQILFILLFIFMVFYLAFLIRRKALEKQKTRLLAQKQMVEFELHALRSQMNPHFVFNSLNAIQYYINDENYDKSEAYLVKFSGLIRMIFEFSRKKDITLRQEIELLRSYLNLEKMRFVETLNFCIDTDTKLNIDRKNVPTLLLQPIVENAVNHGIFHKKDKGTICIKFRFIDDTSYEVLIKDDGVGMQKSAEINQKSLKKHHSRSTQILKERIKLLNMSGKWHITYEIIDKINDTETFYNTIVKLKITKL